MSGDTSIDPAKTDLARRRREARDEWRRFAAVLERAQGDDLAQNCRNRYQFVRTYQIYGSRNEQIRKAQKQAIERHDFSFFTERGIPSAVIDWHFADQLLQDWFQEIQAKKSRLAEIFTTLYGEPIDNCIRTDEEAAQLNLSTPMHEADAFYKLPKEDQPLVTAADFIALSQQVTDLAQRLDELAEQVTRLSAGGSDG